MRVYAAIFFSLLCAGTVHAQVLYRGGEFDFEQGFVFYQPSIFGDRPYDEVGKGWGYWGQRAMFLPPHDRHGHPNFNGNQFAPNVSSGRNSQEITMTSANGDAITWKHFSVPVGRKIRCRLDAITTPSETELELRHAIGQGPPISFVGVTDPYRVGLTWSDWNIRDTSNHFATYAAETVAASESLTYYLWVRHYWATPSGATLCFDNLVVSDVTSDATPTATPGPAGEVGAIHLR